MEVQGNAGPIGAPALTVPSTISYSVGQIIAQSATAASCSAIPVAAARLADKTGHIRRVRLKSDDISGLAGKIVRVHAFKNAPTFANGNGGAFAGGLTESDHIGYVDVTLDLTFSDFVKGEDVPSRGSELTFDPAPGTQNIFLVFEARSAITSGTGKKLTAVLEVFQN